MENSEKSLIKIEFSTKSTDITIIINIIKERN